jgi:uncharacterized protein (DUF2225 family)
MIDIAWLAEHGPCKKFTAGMIIPCPGGPDPAQRAMYILLAGRVDVTRKSAAGGSQMVAVLSQGDIFGGREYFTDADDCTYKAGVDSAVYVITEESFNDLSWSRPEILYDILKAAYLPPKRISTTAHPQKTAENQTKANKAPQEAPGQVSPKQASQEAAQKQAPPKQEPQKQTKQADAQKVVVLQEAQAKTASGKESAQTTPAPQKISQKQAETPKATKPAPAPTAVQETELFPAGHKLYPGVTKPEYAPLVFPKEYKCPYCKSVFKDFRVFRSKLFESTPMRYDLRKYFKDFQTEWYDILTCRSCLFSTFHTYFTEPKPIQKTKIDDKIIKARAEVVLDFDAERNIDYVFTVHYLALLCAEGYPTMGKQIRAKLWGNLSWLYEDVNDRDMEVFSATKASEAYEQVYTESRLTPVQEQITCLSIAGMQHRAGIDSNLKKFLFKAKTLTAGDKTYAKLAEDFMYELKIVESAE